MPALNSPVFPHWRFKARASIAKIPTRDPKRAKSARIPIASTTKSPPWTDHALEEFAQLRAERGEVEPERSTREPLGPEQEHEDHDSEGDDQDELDGSVCDHREREEQIFGDTDDKGAKHRAVRRTDAPENDRREHDQEDARTEKRLYPVHLEREHDAA